MKELTLGTLIAVFEEIFGVIPFWLLTAAALAVTIAFIYLLIRERSLKGPRLLYAELAAPFGAIAAILFVQWVTRSGFSDIGGPVDVIVLVLIGLAGAIGLTMIAYLVLARVARRKRAGE